MSGQIKMYTMRQIVRHDIPVVLPTCMYSLPRIQGGCSDGGDGVDAAKRQNGCTTSTSAASVELVAEQVKQFLKNNQTMTMAAVQQRQQVILQQLDELKTMMTAIRSSLKSGNTPTATKPCGKVTQNSQTTKFNVKQLPTEVSLNINPSHPPYSLLMLQKLWKNSVNIQILSYLHSSVAQLPEPAQNFVESIPSVNITSNLPCVTVRLIWKAIGVNHLELTGSRQIQGEVNLLRYLARATSSLNYNETDCEMDAYLDTCYSITRSKNKTERIPLFQRLNKKLAKNSFMFTEFSIVDVAAYSAIKQTATAGEVNVGMSKWMNNCEGYYHNL